MHSYFSYISQNSVKTHLRHDETYNNHIVAKYPQIGQVKEF